MCHVPRPQESMILHGTTTAAAEHGKSEALFMLAHDSTSIRHLAVLSGDLSVSEQVGEELKADTSPRCTSSSVRLVRHISQP